jgi:hypothetical protein
VEALAATSERGPTVRSAGDAPGVDEKLSVPLAKDFWPASHAA